MALRNDLLTLLNYRYTTHCNLLKTSLFFLCALFISVTGYAAPKGKLLDAIPVSKDDTVICSVYLIKKGKTEAVISRYDGKRHLGKPFWTSNTAKEELNVLAASIKKLGKARTKKELKALKKLKEKKTALTKIRSQLKVCAAGGSPDQAERLIKFEQVKGLIQLQCMNCHGALGWQNDESYYLSSGRVVPGDLEASPFYTFLSNTPEKFKPGYMPKGTAPLSSLNILLLSRWIRDLGLRRPPSAVNPVDPEGKSLYAKYCASCHGGISGSAKYGRSAAQIKAALGLQGTPQMRHLTLSDSEIEKIALALSQVKPPEEGTVSVLSVGAVNEGNAGGTPQKMIFEIVFRGKTAEPFSVGYVTSNGTALAGSDYTFSAGTVQFAGSDGEKKQIIVEITGDSIAEGSEVFSLDIGGLSTGTVRVENSTVQGVILNDDEPFNEVLPVQASKLIMSHGFNGNYLDALGLSPGTPQGDAVLSSAAKVGAGALELDEGSDFVKIPGQQLGRASNLTLTSWVFWENTTSTTSRIFDFGSITPTATYLIFTPKDANSRCRFELRNVSATYTLQCNTGVTMPANRWVHIALTFNSVSDEMKIFFDGMQVATRTGVTLPLSSLVFSDNKLGQSRIAGSADFKGKIDEFMAWDAALSQAEIAQVMALNKSIAINSGIEVRLGAQIMPNGSALSLGNVPVGETKGIAFTISNRGLSALGLPGVPKVQVVGKDSGEFTVEHQPWPWQSLLSNNSFAVFSLIYAPVEPGTKSATLVISNSDQLNGNFGISLNASATGDAIAPPKVPEQGSSPLTQGQYLYNVNCASCHGVIERSQKKGVTSARIVSAISPVSGVTQMKGLILPQGDIDLIALALNSPAPVVDKTEYVETYVVNVGTGPYVANVLSDVFLPEDPGAYTAEDILIKSSITEKILGVRANNSFIPGRIRFFGGRCDRFETLCQAEVMTSTLRPVPNTLRAGFIEAVCSDVVRYDKAVNNVLGKISRVSTAPVDSEGTKALYELFYPARDIPSYLLDVISNYTNGKTELTPIDHWRFQIHLICSSGTWEVM